MLEPVEAAVVGADPQDAIAVLMNRAHLVADEAVAFRERGDLAVLDARQPVEGADPERTFSVLEQGRGPDRATVLRRWCIW